MIAGYELIEELARNEQFRLCRARRRHDGLEVLVKTPVNVPPRASDIAALDREIAILRRLSVAGVLHPLELQPHYAYALVFEDPNPDPLHTLSATGRLTLEQALAVGVQLTTILEELHARGMAHNGIRPDVVLYDGKNARVWLIDLTDASSEDARAAMAGTLSIGRLVYVAPELTGRMGRAADYRSDFYSLGVLLYNLLTGTPPFRSADALELIHSHVARTPPPPADIDAAVPGPVSDIVLKLLAKTPEERYQSASALREDLETCARQLAAHGNVAPFPLGRRDLGDHFLISRKLYGRETEVETLLGAFDRACRPHDGPSPLLLVAGYSGIGKTSLVEELYKPIVRSRGYFISGKFDQVVRSIPFGALLQAFRALVRQFLTESEQRLAQWSDTLARALGTNAGVLAEVIPEIEIIVGKQPPPLVLPAAEALNRFQQVFQNFVATVAQPQHPLVVFLDDLQWADAATLRLLEPLLTSPEIRCLFLMGSYRDNEVDGEHPLARTVASLESAGVGVERIALGPLRLADLAALIADTLHREPIDVEPLARLVERKTGGNPLFVTQFLKALKEDGYLKFDYPVGRWTYRIEAIRNAPITDNVVDLMTRKLQRLSFKTQHAVTLAACIGNPFDRSTLALVSEQSETTAADDLLEAIGEGLVQPVRHPFDMSVGRDAEAVAQTYAFVHDRVQQSAYALIPPERKQSVHLTVGRLLRSSMTAEQADERIFDVVHHLNLGRALIAGDAERIDVAKLDLDAGRKAKSSTAYEAALGYLQAGESLLCERDWRTDYDLAFALHIEAAECEYLTGRFDDAEAHLDFLLEKTQGPLDYVCVQNLRLLQYESVSRYQDAITVGHRALSLCGLDFPARLDARSTALQAEVAKIQALVNGRSFAELADLPALADSTVRMMMKVCTNLHTSCYLSGDKTLTMLNTAIMVRLSLTHGYCEESAYAYALYAAMLMVPVQRDYAAAHEFGQLALEVNDRFPEPAIRARVMMNLGWAVSLWRRPMSESIAISREAHRLGNENGMFVEATYALFNDCWLTLLCARELPTFETTCAAHVEYARRVGMRHFAAAPQVILQWGRALQGQTGHPESLTGFGFDEEAFGRDYGGQPLFEMFYYVAKLALLYTFGRYRTAVDVTRRLETIIRDFPGTIWDEQTVYYHTLTLAEIYTDLSAVERDRADSVLQAAMDRLAVWAENAPDNFQLPYLIVSAEIARLRGDDARAIALFETATAMTSECPRERALANELFGKYWLRRRNQRIAAPFLQEAHALYRDWGAQAKCEALERDYPHLLQTIARVPSTGARAVAAASAVDASHGDALDLFSVMKAAQAIAGEVELDRLLTRLLRIAIENAGAERGSLILERDRDSLHAEGSLDTATVHVRDTATLAEARSLPASIVNYVRRTSEDVVIADAQRDDRYGSDPYIAQHKPRSVMCIPVLKQGRRSGILYLENNMVCGAFTPERIQIMQVLAAEAAIALENAKLFEGLKQEINERKEAMNMLHAALGEVEQLKNALEAENIYLRRDLIANVSHDLRTPLASLRGYLETLLIKEDSLPFATRRSYLEIAFRQSDHLTSLVEELFELAKLDFKGLHLDREPVQLGELASDVMQKFQLAADDKRVSLNVEAPARMPFVRGDTSLLERVLQNLIGNALQHTPPGGQVRVSVAPDGERIVARVADTGDGIPEAEIPFIFDRFYRVDKSRNSASGGAGLGLAITKRIVELHDGDITVETKPKAGTCFSFSLPVDGR